MAMPVVYPLFLTAHFMQSIHCTGCMWSRSLSGCCCFFSRLLGMQRLLHSVSQVGFVDARQLIYLQIEALRSNITPMYRITASELCQHPIQIRSGFIALECLTSSPFRYSLKLGVTCKSSLDGMRQHEI